MEELRNRIIGRGSETEESMARRLGAALEEINNIGQYDYRVVNDDLQEAVGQVQAVISAEQCRVSNEEADAIISRYKEDL
jgi:guanylate kinase